MSKYVVIVKLNAASQKQANKLRGEMIGGIEDAKEGGYCGEFDCDFSSAQEVKGEFDVAAALALTAGAPPAARLEQALRAMVAQYGRLHDMLSDMVERGALTEAGIPDDYRAIVETLTGCVGVDYLASEALKAADAAKVPS